MSNIDNFNAGEPLKLIWQYVAVVDVHYFRNKIDHKCTKVGVAKQKLVGKNSKVGGAAVAPSV